MIEGLVRFLNEDLVRLSVSVGFWIAEEVSARLSFAGFRGIRPGFHKIARWIAPSS